MLTRLWGRFKNWVKQTAVYQRFFGAPPAAPQGERQPLLAPAPPPAEIEEAKAVEPAKPLSPRSPRASQAFVLAAALPPPPPPESPKEVEPEFAPIDMPTNTNRSLFTHSQRATMSLMRKRPGTLFYQLPRDVVKYISRLNHADYDPQSQIGELLHHVAYGNRDAVKAILDKHPRLLLEAGNVEDPAGNTILRVTPYECALGAGDDDMAAMIGEYFAKLENGEHERSRQYARYKDHIDTMLTQPAFDFSALLQSIKDSPMEEVQAALDLNFNADLPLHQALANFRAHFVPREIRGGMHFNYANLCQAFKIYADEFDALYRAGGDDYQKCDLFWRQVIGYMQRLLPACDRQAFAQGIYYLVESNEPLRRSFKFRNGGGEFPITSSAGPLSGLGFDYARPGGGEPGLTYFGHWKTYVEQKRQACKTYAATPSARVEAVRNLLK